MTEDFIRATADSFGLAVLKRIQTGNDARHFADFELSGSRPALLAAWRDLSTKGRGGDFDRLTYVSNPDHPNHGDQFIECKGVWCEIAPAPVK